MLFFAIVAFMALGAGGLFAYMVAVGLRTGIVKSRGRSIPRDKHPLLFWMTVVTYSIAAPVVLFGGLICLRAWSLGCALRSTAHTCNAFIW
jgi:hypothetical protein